MPRSRFQLLITAVRRMRLPSTLSEPSQVVVRARAMRREEAGGAAPLGKEAGAPAVAAEERGAGVAGAGPALVPVRVGDDTDAVILLEGIAQDPLERAPRRVHLDRRLHGIVRKLDVGVTPADVRRQHA